CAAVDRSSARAVGWRAGRQARSQAAFARRVRLLTDPRDVVCPYQQSVCVDGDSSAGRSYCCVMTALVVADVTKGTGRFNLAQGMFGTLMGIGASLSPTLSGLIVHHFGYSTGFLSLALEGLVAFIVLALFLPETKEA